MSLNFPELPSENEDPWYAKRLSWDEFVQSKLEEIFVDGGFIRKRGYIPPNTNLDDFRTSEFSGNWVIRQTDEVENLPTPLTQTGSLLVMTTGYKNSVVQELRFGVSWYSRESFDGTQWNSWVKVSRDENTIISRGELTTLDLDLVTDPSVYRLNAESSYANTPFELNYDATMVVFDSSDRRALTQMIFMANGSESLGSRMAFREARNTTSLGWGEWVVVTDGLINNVVKNEYQWVPDNTISAIVSGKHVGYDFSKNQSGWTLIGEPGEPGIWTGFEASTVFDSGGSLSVGANGYGRRFALWTDMGKHADVEVYARCNFETNSSSSQAGVVLRAQMGLSNGYVANLRGSDSDPSILYLDINRYDEVGASDRLARVNVGPLPDNYKYHNLRFRAEGSTLYAKVWINDDDEPVSWNLIVTDARYSEGYFGVGRLSAFSANRWNTFHVNLEGGRA